MRELLVYDESGYITYEISKCFNILYNITVAKSGDEAIEKLNSKIFDVVLIDLINDINSEGFYILRKLNSFNKNISLVIVAVTNDLTEYQNIFINSMAMGANLCVPAPFDPKMLLARIEKLLPNVT